MVKNCIYCSAGIGSGSVVDICERCMYQVWGEKMAKAIIENMEKEKNSGNLELGRVGEENELTSEAKKEMDIVEFDSDPCGPKKTNIDITPISLEGINLNDTSKSF